MSQSVTENLLSLSARFSRNWTWLWKRIKKRAFSRDIFEPLFSHDTAKASPDCTVPGAHMNRDGIVTTSDCQLISNRGSNFIIFNYTLINIEVFFIHSFANCVAGSDSLNWWFNRATTTALTSRGPSARDQGRRRCKKSSNIFFSRISRNGCFDGCVTVFVLKTIFLASSSSSLL